jgi:hypothetical protein
MSPPGRPKGESLTAKPEGSPASAMQKIDTVPAQLEARTSA